MQRSQQKKAIISYDMTGRLDNGGTQTPKTKKDKDDGTATGSRDVKKNPWRGCRKQRSQATQARQRTAYIECATAG